MSSNTYAAPLALEIAPSLSMAAALAGAHAGALGVLAMLPAPGWIIAALTISVMVHAVYSIRRHALLRDARSVVRVLWDVQGHWTLTQRDGTAFSAKLLPGSYLHPTLTVLNFKVSHWHHTSVVILPRRVEAEDFRKLRVRLMLASNLPE